jgi:RNA polymerase sigma-70 factor (ECF subfamily)
MAALVRDYGPAVRGYLMALVRRADDADDLAQEVFCRAWQSRDRYQEQGHARTYLLRIADRLACDRIRRKKPEETLSDEAWRSQEPWSNSGDPAQEAADAEAAERLRARTPPAGPSAMAMAKPSAPIPGSMASSTLSGDSPDMTTLAGQRCSTCRWKTSAMRRTPSVACGGRIK